ncbi:hypothetical protein BKA93DRAFT_698270, partial [Sparassis latifolia]
SPVAMTSSTKGKETCTVDFEDWQNLKALFTRAADRSDCDDAEEALPLLRAVIRECTRFLTVHRDPSVIFTETSARHSRSPDVLTPTDDRIARDWTHDAHTRPAAYREQPTAFHALFGSALFLAGNILAADPALALPAEPRDASAYWLGALDVFETGENLPSRTSGYGANDAEDWRMAIVWGRTLVALADEKVAHSIAVAKAAAGGGTDDNNYCYLPTLSPFSAAEPAWPPGSPFAAIAGVRPPVSRRALLHSASAHELLVLAMDQFSRGIFHMPHVHYAGSHNPPSQVYQPAPPPPRQRHHRQQQHRQQQQRQQVDPRFSRAKELFTLASEVLGVAERLPAAAQRAEWAAWADSVFTQMRMEAELDAWRAPLNAARGRCWLVVGEAAAEGVEGALEEEGEGMDVLASREAGEAREGLGNAVTFFERARAAGARAPEDENTPLLVEALITLANLTADAAAREELYARAQLEAGADLGLDAD